MKYLITGGAGFIGSHLTETLLGQGHEVFAIDDLSTGGAENVARYRSDPKYHLHVDTIFNSSLVAELVDQADIVVHLAAAVGVFQIVESPSKTIETNIKGTEVVLSNAAKKKKVTLVASTSEVYGKSVKFPFSEDDDCVIGPSSKGRWSYAASKLVDEFLALSYFKEKKLPAIVVRFFNTVGPRQSGQYGMVIPRLIRQALSGGPITIFGDGKQSRCFGYVGDVVGGVLKLLAEPRAYGQVFNLGGDEEITIEELAIKIRSKVDSKVKLKYVPYDQAYEAGFEDMRRRVPDLRKASKLVGYGPTVGIDEILDRVIAFERARR